jgi:hypothetical protein
LPDIQTDGGGAIRHMVRCRISNNLINTGVRVFTVTMVKESYAGSGPTLAADILATHQRDSDEKRWTLMKARGIKDTKFSRAASINANRHV